MSAETASDERWMRRALHLARRGADTVSPNPMVGGVVVRRGRVVGEGSHRRYGGPHGEAAALVAAGRSARGATLYVNLEPCNHSGKQPPCTAAVIAAGVARVVIAMRDPNPAVPGAGIAALRAAGIEVVVGVLAAEAATLNETFVTHMGGRPFVHLKSALSLDGRIATAGGESRWITGEPARRYGQRLRRWADAILIGGATARVDDPRLTRRSGAPSRGRPLTRVVLDTELRLPVDARLLARDGATVLVYGGSRAPGVAARAARLRASGAEIVVVRRTGRGVSVAAVLRDLARRGVGRLLVEGGGGVAASFMAGGYVDRSSFLYAPVVLGGDSVAAVGPLGIARLGRAPRLAIDRVSRLGDDVLVRCRRLG